MRSKLVLTPYHFAEKNVDEKIKKIYMCNEEAEEEAAKLSKAKKRKSIHIIGFISVRVVNTKSMYFIHCKNL